MNSYNLAGRTPGDGIRNAQLVPEVAFEHESQVLKESADLDFRR
jgi:hypothetical protein